MIRTALQNMGRADLIGSGEKQLIPAYDPMEKTQKYTAHRRKNTVQAHQKRRGKKILTQHTGLPPQSQQ